MTGGIVCISSHLMWLKFMIADWHIFFWGGGHIWGGTGGQGKGAITCEVFVSHSESIIYFCGIFMTFSEPVIILWISCAQVGPHEPIQVFQLSLYGTSTLCYRSFFDKICWFSFTESQVTEFSVSSVFSKWNYFLQSQLPFYTVLHETMCDSSNMGTPCIGASS